jgi:Na+/H+-dicarboxylate symporter
MPYGVTEVVVQVAAGMLGGIAAGLAANEYSLGIIKSAGVGAVGGGVGGGLLETVIPPTVTATGAAVFDDSVVNEWVVRVLLAFIVGGMLSLIVGFVKSEMTKPQSK